MKEQGNSGSFFGSRVKRKFSHILLIFLKDRQRRYYKLEIITKSEARDKNRDFKWGNQNTTIYMLKHTRYGPNLV